MRDEVLIQHPPARLRKRLADFGVDILLLRDADEDFEEVVSDQAVGGDHLVLRFFQILSLDRRLGEIQVLDADGLVVHEVTSLRHELTEHVAPDTREVI